MSINAASLKKCSFQSKDSINTEQAPKMPESPKDTVTLSKRSEEDESKARTAKKWITIGVIAGVVALGLIFHKKIWNFFKGEKTEVKNAVNETKAETKKKTTTSTGEVDKKGKNEKKNTKGGYASNPNDDTYLYAADDIFDPTNINNQYNPASPYYQPSITDPAHPLHSQIFPENNINNYGHYDYSGTGHSGVDMGFDGGSHI